MECSEHYAADMLRYFDGKPQELALYETLFEAMDRAFPESSVRVQKSQISFYDRHLFAAASIPVRRKKDWPKQCLLVTFGLVRRETDPRVAVAVEAYPNRWTLDVVVSRPEEIVGQLLGWLEEARDFARSK